MSRLTEPGGTPGGISHFLGGCGLAGLGLYLLFSRVVVSAGGWWHGAFGVTMGPSGGLAVVLSPFVVGLALLFADGKSRFGWVMLLGSLVLLTVEILTSLRLHFQPTSLPLLLVMLGMVGGGVGLVVRSFRSF